MNLTQYAERELGTVDLEEANRRAAVVLEWRREGRPDSPHDGREADDTAALRANDIVRGAAQEAGRDE